MWTKEFVKEIHLEIKLWWGGRRQLFTCYMLVVTCSLYIYIVHQVKPIRQWFWVMNLITSSQCISIPWFKGFILVTWDLKVLNPINCELIRETYWLIQDQDEVAIKNLFTLYEFFSD